MNATATAPVARLTDLARLLLPPSPYTAACSRAMAHGWSYAGPANDGGCYLYPPPHCPCRTVLHVSAGGTVTALPF
jgi:hypothetical protein